MLCIYLKKKKRDFAPSPSSIILEGIQIFRDCAFIHNLVFIKGLQNTKFRKDIGSNNRRKDRRQLYLLHNEMTIYPRRAIVKVNILCL